MFRVAGVARRAQRTMMNKPLFYALQVSLQGAPFEVEGQPGGDDRSMGCAPAMTVVPGAAPEEEAVRPATPTPPPADAASAPTASSSSPVIHEELDAVALLGDLHDMAEGLVALLHRPLVHGEHHLLVRSCRAHLLDLRRRGNASSAARRFLSTAARTPTGTSSAASSPAPDSDATAGRAPMTCGTADL